MLRCDIISKEPGAVNGSPESGSGSGGLLVCATDSYVSCESLTPELVMHRGLGPHPY